MELAGQWRREWAGTAEYGKVTEGGVTRRVARAMEVLHASGPNAKVRVMRAAYHSTSGPGLPVSSYMLHSSRRVISSGFNLLESPTYPTKPLEISSTPLESSPDYNTETENYKVTEPDDTEISEPSKWRGISNGSNVRMPSEESSSTDNASIVDLSHNNSNRKYSYDSENSDINLFKRGSARASPLLEVPTTLSTLKYKSLLNGSNSTSDWNNRRKSYSFENTSPLNETIVHSNETLAMESSTDSGICKSSEIVNEYPEESATGRSFKEWLRKNKENIHAQTFKDYKEHNNDTENNIALQSSGKLCITVPIRLEDDENSRQPYDEIDRKVKKVEFCKTELHFAAESGKVNIIATDEKPPPTNDFRKRRSAFVPINTKYEKPITLFGEKSDYPETNTILDRELNFSHFIENDENTAATRSILKNKIPKPKPYLLGENMAFGDFLSKQTLEETSTPTGVSIINKQLQSRSDNNDESNNKYSSISNKSVMNSQMAINNSPSKEYSSSFDRLSPLNKTKTRQLRENELIYFGVDNHNKKTGNVNIPFREKRFHADFMDAFESVRLVKQASNSTQTSDAESDDTPEYQNLPIKSNFAPIPTPRSRVRYKKPNESVVILKPIIEQHNDTVSHDSRRSRSRKQDFGSVQTSRSLSEPAKKRLDSGMTRHDEIRSSVRKDTRRRYKEEDNQNLPDINKISQTKKERVPYLQRVKSHLYENINKKEHKQNIQFHNKPLKFKNSEKEHMCLKTNKNPIKTIDSIQKKDNTSEKPSRTQRTEKGSTPENIYLKNQDIKKEPTNETSKNRTLESNNAKQARIKANNQLVEQRITEGKEHAISSQDKPCSKRQENHKKVQSKNTNDNILKTSNIHQTRIMPSICLEKQEDTVTRKYATSLKGKSEGSNNANIDIETPKNSLNKKGPPRNTKCSSLESRESKQKTKSDKDSGTNVRKSSRKSEYVIKYDDKNGTVSSVCKVRGRHDTPRQKHFSNERMRDCSKDSKDKPKEKSGLRNATSRTSQACERKNNSEEREQY